MTYIYLKTEDGKSVGRYKTVPEGAESMVPATEAEFEAATLEAAARAARHKAAHPK